jgi:hypothetical protein
MIRRADTAGWARGTWSLHGVVLGNFRGESGGERFVTELEHGLRIGGYQTAHHSPRLVASSV